MAETSAKTASRIESSENRDATQKSLGFIGLSALAHVGVLISVLLAPSFKSAVGVPTGAQAGEEISYAGTTIADPAAPGSEAPSSAPTEVLLADSSDTSAVPMTPTVETQKIETEVVEKPVEKVAEVKPVETKPAVAVKKSAPKVAKAAPAVVAAPESEIAIQQALTQARAEVQTEELPPELDPPQMDEPVSEAQAIVPEETEAKPEEKAEVAPVPEPVATQAETATAASAVTAQPEAPTASQEAASTTSGTSNGTTSGTSMPLSTSSTSGAGNAQVTAPNANGAGTAGASGGGGEKGVYGLPQGTQIRDAGELAALPGNPKPTYPLQDKLAGNQGTTVLIGLVKPDGSIGNVVVEQSSGSKLMDKSAAQAFAKWKFQPGQSGYIRSPFQFQLVGSAKEVPARLRTQ